MTDPSMPDADAPPARLLAELAPGDNAPPLSVSDLSAQLKRHVESGFGHVRIRGEVSGWKRAASGHCYLALKDDKAMIDGVIWKGAAAAIGFRPEDGIEVIATGKLTTYPGRSKYQIVIDTLELAGEGALLALLEKLKAKLGAEGLFDADRKQPIPYLPRTIGVVTSPTGAVIRDILHRLSDRFPLHVIVWPVIVQGQGSAEAVARAIAGFNALPKGGPIARPDLLIVARGGGSIEDLWGFNDEVVVRAVAASAIPLISAVGHETDTTLCDFAADRRAPTPTAAAEMAVPVRADLMTHLNTLALRSERTARRYQERARERLTQTLRTWPTPDALHAPQRQRLDDLGDRLRRGLTHRLSAARAEVAQAAGALRPAILTRRMERARDALSHVRFDARLVTQPLAEAQQRLERSWRFAQSLHPERPLLRGYALVRRADGTIVTSAEQARAAAALHLRFADGEVAATVERSRGPSYGKSRGSSGAQASLFDDTEKH